MLNSKNKQTIEETKNIAIRSERKPFYFICIDTICNRGTLALAKIRKTEKTDLINFNFTKDYKLKNFKGVKDIDYIINFITDLRSIKAKLNISPGNFVDLNIKELPKKIRK